MTYFADLTPYAYLPSSVPPGVRALNVGWLEAGRPFTFGRPPEHFTERLGLLCRDQPRARSMGLHACDQPHPSGGPLVPVYADIGGESVMLGTAEVRVVSATGEWLVAPTLVHHYVTHHGYLPPPDFVEAVLAGRVAGEV
ncbi:hypothetical protein [Streptomyces hainanensis]|uniref:DUF7919 domain-containing protein n=1 Tax=Streptomyces hainanensis TaxID=402648 RepID=A0A4R4TGQ0_9ACTN|nr:hypothetical protein [Streptomyces hainanensis]TDC73499.1 hypothetical protein E1283_19050 [Streptomyces hainanensis]